MASFIGDSGSSAFSQKNISKLEKANKKVHIVVLSIRIDNFYSMVGLYGSDIGIQLQEFLTERVIGVFRQYFPETRILFSEHYKFNELIICFTIADREQNKLVDSIAVFRKEIRNRLNNRENIPYSDILVGHSIIVKGDEDEFQQRFFRAFCEAQWVGDYKIDPERMKLYREFIKILEEPLLECLFQPIFDFHLGEVLGWESFVHGPENSYFYHPANLFTYAENIGKIFALDEKSRKRAVEMLGSLDENQFLFMNVHLLSLKDPDFTPGSLYKLVREKGLKPENVILEFSENHCIQDFGLMYANLLHYRNRGYKIAIDDIGERDLSLNFNALTRIKPDYIKLDPSLIRGIEYNSVNRAIVENMVILSEKIGTRLVGKGIETDTELSTLLSLGVRFGQGYHVGKPTKIKEKGRKTKEHSVYAPPDSGVVKDSSLIIYLVQKSRKVSPDTRVEEVAKSFSEGFPMGSVVIVENERPVGLLMKYHLDQKLGTQFGVSLFYHRKISSLMDSDPLIVDIGTSLEDAARAAMNRDNQKIYDDIIVTKNEVLIGTVSVRKMLETMVHVARKERDAARGDNKKITDSLRYAKLIQESLLPHPDHIRLFIPRSFFIQKPKDIVGGDTYYVEELESGFILAVVDCTGHGVPGALMTMIAISGLKRIIKDEKVYQPDEVLKRLNYIVKTTLKQDTKEAITDDGLDAAVCYWNKKDRTMNFAGARLGLITIKNGHLNFIKGNRMSIGYIDSDLDYDFDRVAIAVDAGFSFYMFTDGYIDQLGGMDRLPFGKKSLGKLLAKIEDKPFEQQKKELMKTFEKYRGNNDIQDDITIVGFHVQPD